MSSSALSSLDLLSLDVETIKQQMLSQRSSASVLRKANSNVDKLKNSPLLSPSRPSSVPAKLDAYRIAMSNQPQNLLPPVDSSETQLQSPIFKSLASKNWLQTFLPQEPVLYSFLSLPDAILLLIANKLGSSDILHLSRVCSRLRKLIQQNLPQIGCIRCCLFNQSDLRRKLCACQAFEVRAATIASLSSNPESDSTMNTLLESLRMDADGTIRSLCLTALASKYLANEQTVLAIQKVAANDQDQLCRSQAARCLHYRQSSTAKTPPKEKKSGSQLSNSFSSKPRKSKYRSGESNKENVENKRARSSSTGTKGSAKVAVVSTPTDCVVMRIDTPLQNRYATITYHEGV